jgi:hypothetical protein
MRRDLGRLSWLMSASHDLPLPLGTEDDLERVADFLLGCWQVLPLTLPRFSAWAGKDERARPIVQRARARMLADGAVLELQSAILDRLAKSLHDRSVPFVLLKSAAMRLIAYDDPRDRRARDIDIGVARSDLERAADALVATGFEKAQWHEDTQTFVAADLNLRAAIESNHYELGFWVRLQEAHNLDAELRSAIVQQHAERPAQWDVSDETAPAAFIVVDVHHGVSLTIPVDDIVASALVAADGKLPVPRRGWMLFHLVLKIYTEGVSNYSEGVYQYADLCRLVPLLDDDDFVLFCEQVDEHGFRAAAYYVLRRLPSEFGVPLPQPLEQRMGEWAEPDPTRAPSSENDWGDMWPKLWGAR